MVEGSFGFDGGLEEGQEGDGGEVHGRDVDAVGLVPGGYGLVLPEFLLEVVGVLLFWWGFGAAYAGVALDKRVSRLQRVK